jgi:hypothetical protein
VQQIGFRVQLIGFRVQLIGFRVQLIGFRVQLIGFRHNRREHCLTFQSRWCAEPGLIVGVA